MTHSSHTLPRSGPVGSTGARGAVLLAGTAAVVFFTTGAGMLESRAVYPSWYDLAAFPGFAPYHAAYGLALLPWLPLPLLVATLLNVWLLVRPPAGVPRWLPAATLVGQLVVVGVTVVFALPLQAQLATPGHSPSEITGLVDRLRLVGWGRDLPGLAVAVGHLAMLARAVRTR